MIICDNSKYLIYINKTFVYFIPFCIMQVILDNGYDYKCSFFPAIYDILFPVTVYIYNGGYMYVQMMLISNVCDIKLSYELELHYH